ncbi:guanitoxin biosynthesis L-enduracididine beta-hydroxylase GntD [Paractinoplanes rishiriensis]|uniref:L-asparagine oxygenase n=1 Tax=Paractinoplanes rishiriensis TaxID=1050105 RepID=A0A919K2K3_9ACTN|nr:guanitoxin biosynthesis L-enduracididine beta-hydroxylase GntD [Actinoplanes rishiriensis]GIE99525.1 L-asparagine oxygenase [Actinoplanes rishiriensis]
MDEIRLTAREVEQCRTVVRELAVSFGTVEDPELLARATVHAQELPRPLRYRLNDFRLAESSAAVLISGFPVDEDRIGPTPERWGAQPDTTSTFPEEAFFLLCASLLGEPFGWATQQGSRLVHDIVPIRGHEELQLNSASTTQIWWHVEDAFHPFRAEYLGMMCMRNPDRVATTYAPVNGVKLASDVVDVLFQPRFVIRPDESHQIEADAGDEGTMVRRSYERVGQMRDEPVRIAVFFGDRDAPYLRLDPYFMDRTPDDPEAEAALAALSAELDRTLTDLTLAPGQIVFVDNYRAVHGRNPFRPRYDGRDRWLKRVNVTRDLRKSRELRAGPDARVLY